MTTTETLSVRLDLETRRTLDEAAKMQGTGGASALARQILERWAADERAAATQGSIERAAGYLRTHRAGWNDEPRDFFSGVKDA
jgi:hypothetical protein